MKRSFILSLVILAVIGIGFGIDRYASGQEQDIPVAPETALFTDDFDYSGLLTANGWSAHSGGGTNSPATTAGLTYAGFPGSGVGNAALIGNAGGEDVNKPLSAEVNTNGAVVYYSFLVNVTEPADKTGDYFIHIGDRASATSFTLFAARIFARVVSSQVNFGLSNTSTATYGATNFNKNQTYLIIVKYTINTAGNDTTSMWVIPSGVPASEASAGTPEVTNTGTAGQDIIDAIGLRQGSNSTQPQAVVDGIRVGTTWADVTGSGSATTPPKLFETYLNGASEVPPNASTARGYGRVVLNDAETQITASLYWEGLGSNTSDAHIHGPAAAGANAGVIFGMTPPGGSTGGSAENRVFAVTPQQVADLKAGLWYFNIHSASFPGGEIRGQLAVARSPVDFNGDGMTDFSVVRGATPAGAEADAGQGSLTWYNLLNGPGAVTGLSWGVSTDRILTEDFDGDAKSDIAVWRPGAQGQFFIIQSSNSTVRVADFGQTGDDPTVVGDYDGDGKADLAVFRQGHWWYLRSSVGGNSCGPTNCNDVTHGQAGDVPAPGDYDGDGKNDFAVHRDDGGGFVRFWLLTAAGVASNVQFGLFDDLVVPGDYDGDGRTDLAVARNASGTGIWFWRPSGGGADVQVVWGDATQDEVVQGDYDGDGKTDQAVWRPSNGVFYVRRSTGGTLAIQWGMNGDFATASFNSR